MALGMGLGKNNIIQCISKTKITCILSGLLNICKLFT